MSLTPVHIQFIAVGALWTIGLSAIAFIGGSILGFALALARISPSPLVRRLASG